MSKPLAGKIALVTGGGRGIGRAIALALAEAGARVGVAARSEDDVRRVADEIRAGGGEAISLACDIADPNRVELAFAQVENELGPLDILIANAGVGAFGALLDLSPEDLDNALAVNVRGTFLCCRRALRAMRSRGGAIITIGSVVGFRGYPDQGAYVASKHAVHGLTKTLAVEAAEYGVRVSTVLPGGVDTPMIAAARPDLDRSTLLAPEDVARTVLFLLTLPERAAIDEIYLRRRDSRPF